MNPDPVAPLDPRIAALEHRVRRLQLALGLAGALVVVACTTAAVEDPPREVRAESFVVVDRQGREWGRLGCVGDDGRGVHLRLAAPGEEVATESGSAEVLLAVQRGYERVEKPVASPETRVRSWAAVPGLASDAGGERHCGVNVFAHVDGASVDAWLAEKRRATLGAHGGGARLQLVETVGATGEEGGEDEVGALDLRLEAGSPALEGRSRDGGTLFHLRRGRANDPRTR